MAKSKPVNFLFRLEAQFPAERQAIHAGEHEVQDDHVDGFCQRQVHRADTVVREIGDMAPGTEIVANVLADVPVVFDHQYAHTAGTQRLCHRFRPPGGIADTYSLRREGGPIGRRSVTKT